MYGYRPLKMGIYAHASQQAVPLESRVSNQKLVRDDVVFKQVRDRDAELFDAIRRINAAPIRDVEPVEDAEPA